MLTYEIITFLMTSSLTGSTWSILVDFFNDFRRPIACWWHWNVSGWFCVREMPMAQLVYWSQYRQSEATRRTRTKSYCLPNKSDNRWKYPSWFQAVLTIIFQYRHMQFLKNITCISSVSCRDFLMSIQRVIVSIWDVLAVNLILWIWNHTLVKMLSSQYSSLCCYPIILNVLFVIVGMVHGSGVSSDITDTTIFNRRFID